jgi:hypothetical protein
MIPLRDIAPSRNYPVVTITIIAVNVTLFLFQLTLGPNLQRFIYFYGLVPARYSVAHIAEYFSGGQQIFALFSFMFLHGGFIHLIGNMWSLYIFGDNVEDQLGHLRYLLFYLLCGLFSGVSHLLLNWHSNVPTIGASGAIAGVMGAYIVVFPNARILTLIPILIFPWFVEIKALYFLGFWFVMQFFNATLAHGGASGVAWWAHVGGFVCGAILLKFFRGLPAAGVSDRLRPLTTRRKTSRFQMLHPRDGVQGGDTCSTITISPLEAIAGTHKLVNVPAGFYNRMVRVTVPPGIKSGQKLRLKGLGQPLPQGGRGDLFLEVVVSEWNLGPTLRR